MIELLLLPLLAALGLTLATGPLGCFIVWNKMSYFGDTLAHSGLLGVTLGLLFAVNLPLSILVVCVMVALLLWLLQRNDQLGNDTLLGILSHSALALGLVCVSLLSEQRVNVSALLFGDLLTVTYTDVIIIFTVSCLSLALLFSQWRRLLLFVTDPDLARVEGHPVGAIRLLLMLLIALVIAAAMRVVGVLLITALMIIPAAAARLHASSPEAMACISFVFGIIAVISGVLASFWFDLPVGPAIVLSAAAIFALSRFMPQNRLARR